MPMNEYGEIVRPETISDMSSQSPQNNNNNNNEKYKGIIGILVLVIVVMGLYSYFDSKDTGSSQTQNGNEPNYYEYAQETDDYTETDNYTGTERTDTPTTTPTPESPLAWVDGVTDVSTGEDIHIPGATSSSYVWPEANSRYYSESDLDGMTQGEVRYLINEIYARNGYIFKKPEWQSYFDQKDWYNPSIPYYDFDPKTYLNSYEYGNVEMINRYQDTHGYQTY